MRFAQRPRCPYLVTDHKRAAASRLQRRQRDALPLLDYWNAHRWLPGDPSYLLDMLHGYARGRLVIDNGQVRAARSIISPAEAVAAFGRPKPPASGWFGGRLASPGSAT